MAGAGLAVGLAYLTRPEGLFVAVPLGWPWWCLACSDTRPEAEPGEAAGAVGAAAGRAVGRAAAPGAFGVPMLVCVAPYASFLHTHTGAWELSAKTQDASIEAWHAVARDDREARDEVLYDIDDGFRFTAESHSLPSLARGDPGGLRRHRATNLGCCGHAVIPDGLARGPAAPAGVGAGRVGAVAPALGGPALLMAWALLPVATAAGLLRPAPLPDRHRGAGHRAGGRRGGPGAPAACFAAAAVSLAPAPARHRSVFAFYGGGGWWHPNDHTGHGRPASGSPAHRDRRPGHDPQPDRRLLRRPHDARAALHRP